MKTIKNIFFLLLFSVIATSCDDGLDIEPTDKITADELFGECKYFLSEEMTLVDTCLVPFLWRLEHYGIDWEELPKSIRTYAHMIFRKDSFKNSVTEQEREMRFDF